MKRVIRLTAWNWHMARGWQLVIAALMALVQMGLLLWFSLEPENAVSSYGSLFTGSGCPLVFGLAYLLAAVAAQRPLILGKGRSRAAYTMLTFQMPRWQLLLAQTLATLLPLVLLIAWQLVLYAAFYGPVCLLQGSMGVLAAPPALEIGRNFWWESIDSLLLRLLLPLTLRGGVTLLLLLAGPAVLAPSLFLHTGWRRVAALAAAVAGALCALLIAYEALSWQAASDHPAGPAAACWLAALILGSWLWSLRSLHRAEPAA